MSSTSTSSAPPTSSPSSSSSSMPSPAMVLATTAYMLVAAAGVVPFLIADKPEFILVWLGIVTAGSVGHAILGRLATVANTLGTQNLTNGDNVVDLLKHVAAVEEYSHTKAHEHGNALTRIEGKLERNAIEFGNLGKKLDELTSRLEDPVDASTVDRHDASSAEPA